MTLATNHPLHAVLFGGAVGLAAGSGAFGFAAGGAMLWWMRSYGHTLGPFAPEAATVIQTPQYPYTHVTY